jgi:hypothetical protein
VRGDAMIEWVGIEGEITPKNRRDYIHGVLSETTYGEDDSETGVVDLLADLKHFSLLDGIDFDDCLRRADAHFKAEQKKGES